AAPDRYLGTVIDTDSIPLKLAAVTLSRPGTVSHPYLSRVGWRYTPLDAVELPMTHAIRLFLVDDHTIIREGMANMLCGLPQFVVVGQADSAEAAQQALPAAGAEVAIV